MGEINGQESISVSFYNSLLEIGATSDGEGESPRPVRSDARQVRMSSVPNNYSTVNRLIDETDDRLGKRAEKEQSLSGLTKRLAEMFEQKQALVAELKSERIKSETIESERDDLQRKLDRISVDYDQALAQVEQSKISRERATKFMEDMKEATTRVINESRNKVADSEDARIEAERAYQDEHTLRRNIEQLLQELRAENDDMGDKVASLTTELQDMTAAKDDVTRRLQEAEQSIEGMHAEQEAHVSRIDHLTRRNELLARNFQSIKMEHSELRRQFDATAVSHAALSADYEALMRRCTDAEMERDQLRIESINHASFSASEMNELRDELTKARNVLVLLRPIIQKAGIGDLRKGDIRLLDERLSDYEGSTKTPLAYPDVNVESMPSQQTSESSPTRYSAYQEVSSDMESSQDSGVAEQYPSPMTTADLYAALETEVSDMVDNETATDASERFESMSFVDMFGKPKDDNATDSNGGASSDEYDFDEFEDYEDSGDFGEFDEFDDLDEPDGIGEYATVGKAGSSDYRFDLPEIYDDSDTGEDFAFPEDLKRGDAQIGNENPSYDDMAVDSGDDFELDNLSDFNAIMADFAHYTAEGAI